MVSKLFTLRFHAREEKKGSPLQLNVLTPSQCTFRCVEAPDERDKFCRTRGEAMPARAFEILSSTYWDCATRTAIPLTCRIHACMGEIPATTQRYRDLPNTCTGEIPECLVCGAATSSPGAPIIHVHITNSY